MATGGPHIRDYYHRTSLEQQRWGFELLGKVPLKGDERVLDLGCGEGTITAEISRRVPKGSVLGIDKSEDRIRIARKHFPVEAFPNLRFEIGDARDLAFEGEFDTIFSNAVLHWIKDQTSLLRRIKKSLTHGGTMFAQMGGKGNAAGILAVVEGIITSKKWFPYFRDFSAPYTFYTISEYGALLKAAGFRIRRIEEFPRTMVHPGKDGLASWISTTWRYYTDRVPEGLRSAFVEEISDAYISHQHLNSNDTIPVAMMRIEVEAENPVQGFDR